MNFQKGPLTVSQLNEYLKMLMDSDELLSDVMICGEISNFKGAGASGHLYFVLKDEDGQLGCAMFRSYADRLRFRPENGMRVIVRGHISLYGPRGQYQLYVESMQPDGVGALALQFEQLKRRLQAEGLFDAARKKPIPKMPRRVGIITSPVGAAIHDMIHISKRRFPCAELILFPSQVQGSEAPEQLIAGLAFFDATEIVDVIIIGRGGGSTEDLWAFNDEMLARQIASCRIPVISAVGHESDFTICDFVADLRAPTPSAAAELALPDRSVLLRTLAQMQERLTLAAYGKVASCRAYLEQQMQSYVIRQPQRITEAMRTRLSHSEKGAEQAAGRLLENGKERLAGQCARLEALSPLSVLKRGYAVVTRNGKTVTDHAEVEIGDELSVRLASGSVGATVTTKEGLV